MGNQTNTAGMSFGTDFDVNAREIIISQLGVFDSGQDGLIAPITVALYERSSRSLLTSITFAAGSGAGSGTLIGGSRFLDIAPIVLQAGFQASIIVFGYGDGDSAEKNGNSYGAATSTASFPWTMNDGGGLISFVGSGRYSARGTEITFPTIVDSGPTNRYAAGAFRFAVVPEPGSILLLGLGAAGAAVLIPRWRTAG